MQFLLIIACRKVQQKIFQIPLGVLGDIMCQLIKETENERTTNTI